MDIEHIRETLDRAIKDHRYGTEPRELYDPIVYIMELGGKRFRPLLTMLSASLFTENLEKIVHPAMAVELFHNFTLMHDDIMDRAPLRRGQPTVHQKWNENTAILSGDVMLVRAYDLLVDVDPGLIRQVLIRFGKTASEVCEGQQLDMIFELRNEVTTAEYIEMIRLKTSVLVGFAMELGGILGLADEKTCRLLYEAGEELGLGFQLKDDLLDVYGDPDKFGKQVGGDIIANKKTFLLIEALKKSTGETRDSLRYWMETETFDASQKVEAVRGIYDSLDVKSFTEQEIQARFSSGIKKLEQIHTGLHAKNALIQFVQQLIVREK